MVSVSQLKQNSDDKITENKTEGKHDENYWINVLLYFASFLVGLGIIAEIAYNWSEISNLVKLVGAITALVINGGLLIWCVKNEKKVLKKVVACIYAFLIMGVIGLIGQIFQLQANVVNGCLLWALTSWPLLFFVPELLWLWLPFFFIGMRFQSTIFHEVAREIIGSTDNSAISVEQVLSLENVYIQVLSAIGLYGYFIFYTWWVNSNHLNRDKVTKPLRFYCGVLMLGIYGSIVELVRYHPATAASLNVYMRVFLPYLLLAALIFAMNKWKNRVSFMPLFFTGTIFEALLAEQMNHRWLSWSFETAVPGVYVMLLLVYAYYHRMNLLRNLMTLVAIIWAIVTFEENIFDIVPSLLLCALFAYLAYKSRSRKGFNAAVILAVIRILIYYADVDNLQYMGFYLIGSGLLIIATILGLTKYAPLLWRSTNEK